MERPILYTGSMVRAILEGRKAQTRRVVKPQPKGTVFFDGQWLNHGYGEAGDAGMYCPYGQPGDRLWVRETVWIPRATTARDRREGADTWPKCIYSADTDCAEIEWMREMRWKQRPSIHMPRWASRITLEITDVRVQRVQDINAEDCIAEGLSTTLREHDACCDLADQFHDLWDSINAKRGLDWGENPWVWALTFKRVEE